MTWHKMLPKTCIIERVSHWEQGRASSVWRTQPLLWQRLQASQPRGRLCSRRGRSLPQPAIDPISRCERTVRATQPQIAQYGSAHVAFPSCAESSVYAQVLMPLQWYDLIWVAALPGISEELLFRGALIPALFPDW